MKNNHIAFANLRAEMGRFELTERELALSTGIRFDRLRAKLAREAPLDLEEAFLIAGAFPRNNAVAYLFAEADGRGRNGEGAV
ncbi:hypothetical protein H8711_11280 [Clostridiaceae bacterium NSJ-31]|uniref:Uncharacterized protein n=1 Tax=Ligaoa zhengdingensis TaxID=2763658 RepID=A0A926E1N3_9FIRM|nr:hypothetical protein [Ligaoa zhengdingensis]MBC8547507.1 hypothetical protein [Ligaoa zhengdingensis]